MTHHLPTSRAPLPPPRRVDNRFGWAGLLAGICGLTLFWLPYFFPAAGLAGIAFGAVGYSKAQTGAATNKRTAMTGIVLGVLALVLPVMGILGLGVYTAFHGL
jgi:hypothetical protein